jgi:hypothetical protein
MHRAHGCHPSGSALFGHLQGCHSSQCGLTCCDRRSLVLPRIVIVADLCLLLPACCRLAEVLAVLRRCRLFRIGVLCCHSYLPWACCCHGLSSLWAWRGLPCLTCRGASCCWRPAELDLTSCALHGLTVVVLRTFAVNAIFRCCCSVVVATDFVVVDLCCR